MTRMRRFHFALVALGASFLVACGPDTPAPVSPAPTSSAPPVESAPRTSASNAPPPAAPPSSDPTVLTDAQKARDAARVPAARAIVDAYANSGGFFTSLIADWSPDGKTIIYNSARDGLPEIYASAPTQPEAAPTAITRGPERALSAQYTPDGKSILFLRDAKGDENHHIWKIAVGATPDTAVDLTPGEDVHRDDVHVARKKPGTMLYTVWKRTSPGADLRMQSIAEKSEPKVVYTSAQPGGVEGVSSDGAHALFSVRPSIDEAIVQEVDIATGKSRRFYPAEGKKSGLTGAVYSADDQRIFICTDEGSEGSVLLALDAKTGKELARYVNDAPKTAPLEVVVSPKGDILGVASLAGDHGEIRILDAKTLKLKKNVTVPLGEIRLGSFRPDGKAFSILVSEPSHPPDPFSVDVATGTVRPLRADKRPGLESLVPVSTKIERVKAFDGLDIPVNRYLPGADAESSTKKLPVVAIFHGGPASSYPVRWSPFARFFLSLGYAVVEPNVRGSTGFGRAYEMADNKEKRADWLKDLESINAWLKAQAWCDPSRVFVWGQSYGGYTTLMALTRQPTLWRAGVDLYGVADLKQFMGTTNAVIRTILSKEFGEPDTEGDLLDRYSPMRDVDKITAPLFVYAGQHDPRVPRSESDTIVKALRARGVPVEYMVAENEGHSVDRSESKIELLTRTARFFEDVVASPPK
jgi:dipeptidyl aminopeptidase/acylaminoacyl peptidase